MIHHCQQHHDTSAEKTSRVPHKHFSAHDTRGTYSLAHHSKQWTCRNFPFPLKRSSPSSCSSPGAGGASQSPPSGSFHLLHSVSIILPFTVTSCLSSHRKHSLPEFITVCLSLSDAVSFSLRCECCSLALSHPSEKQVTPHNQAAHWTHYTSVSYLTCDFRQHHVHLHYHHDFQIHKQKKNHLCYSFSKRNGVLNYALFWKTKKEA